jgi:hypothetical protein
MVVKVVDCVDNGVMRFFRRVVSILGLSVLLTEAAAQSGTSIFAPFVSQASAEVSGSTVRLTWVDAPSVKGPVYVYRARIPFSGPSGRDARAGQGGREVPYGQQIFIEEVESLGMWYYFIAASDETRRKYEIVVPFNNIIDIQLDGTAKHVSASPGTAASAGNTAGAAGTASVAGVANTAGAVNAGTVGRAVIAPQSGAAGDAAPSGPGGIGDIAAQAMSNGIHISFSSSDWSKNALLYRSSRPIAQYNDILGAALVKDRLVSPFVDYPPPGTAFYYAIIYEEDIRSGQAAIYPGANATAVPVYPVSASRGAAVPTGAFAFSSVTASRQQDTYLDPGAGYFSTVRSLSPLTAEAAKVAESIRNWLPPAPVIPPSPPSTARLEPRVFNQDIQSNAARGEDYDLALIVRGPFFRKEWSTARFALEQYLSAGHSQNAVMRARFYLGQCCYFLDDARSALNEFAAVHTAYPNEAAGWLQAALAKAGEQRQ